MLIFPFTSLTTFIFAVVICFVLFPFLGDWPSGSTHLPSLPHSLLLILFLLITRKDCQGKS